MKPVRIRYQTIEIGDLDIHIRCLRDRQQYSDPLGEAEDMGISSAQWPLFGVVWESSKVLAREMLEYAIDDKRILEIGCGIGLSSLLLNSRNADISATDHHPRAGSFLEKNVRLNGGPDIPFLRTDWNTPLDGLGIFDVIIGADILYERTHADLVSAFIDRHAKQDCEVILVDPDRGQRSEFTKKMAALGYAHEGRRVVYDNSAGGEFKGQVLRYLRA